MTHKSRKTNEMVTPSARRLLDEYNERIAEKYGDNPTTQPPADIAVWEEVAGTTRGGYLRGLGTAAKVDKKIGGYTGEARTSARPEATQLSEQISQKVSEQVGQQVAEHVGQQTTQMKSMQATMETLMKTMQAMMEQIARMQTPRGQSGPTSSSSNVRNDINDDNGDS